MTLNHELVGVPSAPWQVSWTDRDTLLYALGVGAGQADPLRELEFTTENSLGVEHRALPTLAVVLAQRTTSERLGDFDPALLVHAEQSFQLDAPLAPSGSARIVATVTGMYDKGSGALIQTESTASDPTSGARLFRTASAVFIKGEGGFGGDRGPAGTWTHPDRPPDCCVSAATRSDQALLYRLSGDRNPLHSDPEFARRGGFDRPILHGLCTYGFAGRALLGAAGPGQTVVAMSGRFTAPVYPGANLTTSIWRSEGHLLFQTAVDDGTVVIDRGTAELGTPAERAA